MNADASPAFAADAGGVMASTAAEFGAIGGGLIPTSLDSDRWRELFPLPHSFLPERVPGVSTSSRRRRAKVRDRIQEVNSVIDCLNEMYYPDVHHDFGDATVAQRACQHSLFQQLSQLPKSRDTCTEREAVQELLRCTATYEEDGCMNTVQAYDRDLVSLPEVGGVPVDLAQVLDPAGRDFVVDPVAHMMLDEEEWGHVVEQGDFVRPYMDSRLQHDPVLYGQFVKDLYEKGMLSFTAQPLEIVPPFFVRKKNGRLRLILDCRAVNLRFKRPPPLALGAGTSWAQVSLPVGEKLFVAQSDIKDYFYSLALPAELQRYFCMPAVSLSMLQALGISDDLDMHCDSEGLVFPMLRVIPMGWSWAMWLSQRVHQHLCLEASGLDISRVVVEGKAAPDISDGEVILIPYADNLNVAGIDECRVQLIKNQIVAELRRVGFRVHEEMEASCLAQSLGFLIDGERGIISPVPDRLRKVRLALNWLSRQPRVRGREVERLLGHCIHFMLLRRELLSIFRSLYDFIYSSYHKRQVLFAAAAKEARWASHLLGLCSCDLKRPWSQNVTASDASLSGIAVCKTEWPVMDVAQIGRQRESWRYKYKSKPAPRKSALNSLDPFEDVLTVKPEPGQAEDPFELNEFFEEVPEELMNPDHWHEVFAVHMQHAEHITLLEGRGIVAALRHKFRSVAEFGMKHLHFNDNMSMVLLCSKGRSGAFPMLRVCRRICSLLLATNCQLLCRWIPSEVNVADKPSRRWEHLRTGNAVGSGSGVKHQIDQACYPNRTRDAKGTYPAVSWNHQEEGAAGEEVSESQAYDSPEGNTGSESCCSTRSPTLQRSDQLGATRGVTPSGAGLCQEDQRFEDLRPPAQAGSSTHPEVDEACCMFLNCIFEQGVDLHEGTKLWAAVADAFPDFGQKDKLPRTRRALQGWHKVDPQRTRPPIPWQLVAAISMKMLARQRVHSSLAVLTMFSAYLRPSECLFLQKSDLMKPMPGHKHYSLHLHPSARQEVSKVGLSDESILLDSVTLPWLGLALDRLDSPDQYLFNLHYSSLAHHWKQALVDLGLQAGHCVLYQLRHAGPSHDRLHHLRSALEVKQRGRWAADSSVRRYEAHGRVSQEFYLLPDMVQQESTRLEEKLQREGLKCFCPQRR